MSKDIIEIVNESEEECEIDLRWYYHSSRYKHDNYMRILEDGIKCNSLLNKSWTGRYNGPYYISLSKITIPDNLCFLNYACSDNPSFVVDGIEPIECQQLHDYEKYIGTRDKRRVGNLPGEYQYYYHIKSEYIKGILYNLYYYISTSRSNLQKTYIKEILDLIQLLNELKLDVPIYDYSRRDLKSAHTIHKEKLIYLTKELI